MHLCIRPTLSIAFAIVIFLATSALNAADDAYHTSLRNQLQDEFGISGGTWMFADNETTTVNRLQTYGGVQSQIVDVTGQTFAKAFRATSPTAMRHRWNRAIYTNGTAPVSAGDTMLLVFWVRSISAQASNGVFMTEYRNASAPWESSLNKLYAPTTTWQQWFVPFEMQDSFAADSSTIAIQIASQQQTLEFGGIALLNFEDAYSVQDLDPVKSLHDEDYPGRELNANWRTAAAQRIELHRKADMTVNVVDQDGNPVANANVDIQMQKHAYQFGTAINTNTVLEDSVDGDLYRQKILDVDGNGHGFNVGTTEGHLQWIRWEQSNEGVLLNLDWMRDNGIAPRGHSIVWPRDDWPTPEDVRDNVADTDYLASRVEGHINEKLMTSGVNGQIGVWDFVNELAHESFFSTSFATLPQYATGDEVFGEWLILADSLEPNAKMFYNEYELLNDAALSVGFHDAHKELIHLLQTESGNRLEGLGIQGHVTLPFAGPERVLEFLDEYATEFPELEIQITEFDSNIANDELSADYLRDFMMATFSHPQTSAFIMWGFWDGRHWLDNAPLFYQDWSPKPAYSEYINLVFDQWWTDEQTTTDDNGITTTRGFMGDYKITASLGGKFAEVDATIEPGKNELTIVLPIERTFVVAPKTFDVTSGFLIDGGIPEILESDNEPVEAHGGNRVIVVEASATSPTLNPTRLTFRVEQKHVLLTNSRLPIRVTQTVELFNFDANEFEQVNSRRSDPIDRVLELQFTDNPGRFVDSNTGQTRVRLSYSRTGLVRGIRALIDQIEWEVTN